MLLKQTVVLNVVFGFVSKVGGMFGCKCLAVCAVVLVIVYV